MQDGVMQAWLESSHLAGGNMAYVEELFELYLDDPTAVGDEWRKFFDQLPREGAGVDTKHSAVREQFRTLAKNKLKQAGTVTAGAPDQKQVKVLQLINAYRFRGHQHANLDPLDLWKQEPVADLSLEHHDLSKDDFDKEFNVGSLAVGQETMKLGEIFEVLNNIYCGPIGAEYMHIVSTEEKRWIQQRLEGVRGRPEFKSEQQQKILKELIAADGLEKYLGSKFPGAKRFSLEGGDSLIPMLKALISRAGEQGGKEVVIGMAHRGRLNVLVNVLGKKPQDLFDEFAGKHSNNKGSGDVKYHSGFSSDFATPGGDVHLALAFNPSHLEIVNPVVMGSVRARMDRLGDKTGAKVLPITIHGDSAIAGQGIVQETFNMSQTRAYQVGGSIRIVVNNQVGFTTSKREDTRSTQYCTDIAKMVQAPIFHVNADDPEAVVFVTQLALDFRNTFKRDVMIDLVCYRRHGHNEADEPSATQPLMYTKVKKHPVARAIYAERLSKAGVLESGDDDQLVSDYRDALDKGEIVVDEWREMKSHSSDWTPYIGQEWDVEYDAKISKQQLEKIGVAMSTVPKEHKLHSRVQKVYEERMKMANGEKAADWGFAETLAYATLVDEGVHIRLTGQDSGRGTFFHRHAVLHNQKDAATYMPLNNIRDGQGQIEIYDSVLSEAAVVAFEYGYATAEPKSLVMWEAQFGDFVNGAQVVIDQFLSSGEQKWGRLCGLTLLLPHGYEGQGPEHSSARLERFLQLSADHNWSVCVPTTPAQVFHMIRRQQLRPVRRPLIVMTPKSLLRHPLAVSELDEMTTGTFQNAIGEIDSLAPKKVKRVVICSGKVYYDLLQERRKREQEDVAIIRIEQLYPFPAEEVAEIMKDYQHVKDFVWCQEEPQNQGAWYSSQHNFRAAIPKGAELTYAGREASAAPAVGYLSEHNKQQQKLVDDALTIK
ncbi:2-oxoglutarate dehydrogenase E1 component [Pseudidiomarina donghaiensis]|uniref:2-oxoglutarate dehydrogenase E1 component n=1 Tax=Pseudidiomarina donghaiensis TaxID=519452 RepID=A0A432XDK4_9GAMM|nr:2-oxoglutarate dehydrogenase E1 component [Pseudidiomarina donghaiensis]RUO46716.1 2-oxoglutarate dehydrogenase E1 component [Pseudidiomarina donghaiensis]SFV24465.1 2-oxoglutarate dehydrogenase E1 component [Pseudidiomarina donghaiensis]